MTDAGRSPARDFMILSSGTCLLFFDFGLYSLFAVQIAAAFFPAADFTRGLLWTFAAFSLSFLTRPLGAWLLGRQADRHLRSSALTLSFALMGGGSFLIAITPGYATIGAAAPLLLIVSRLAQGLAAGGEPGPAIALMVEIAPAGRKGLYASAVFAGQAAALAMGALLAMLLHSLISEAALAEWGWRLCFLLSALIAPFGLFMRRRLHEPAHQPPAMDLSANRSAVPEVAILGMLLGIGATLSQYLISYMTTFLQTSAGSSLRTSLVTPVILGLTGVLSCVAGGLLADRIGLRQASLLPRIALLALVAVFIAAHAHLPAAAAAALALLLAVAHFLALGVTGLLVAIKIARASRATTIGVVYALAVTLFGGTAHLAFTWLIQTTGWPLSPLVYVGLANLLSLFAAHRITSGAHA